MLATVIIAVLLMLSGTLTATSLFPTVDVTRLTIWLAIALVTSLIAAGVALPRRPAPRAGTAEARAVAGRESCQEPPSRIALMSRSRALRIR